MREPYTMDSVNYSALMCINISVIRVISAISN